MAEICSDFDRPDHAPAVGPAFGVLIIDKTGASFYVLPDPRVYPRH
jgi:hypothetical protein